MPTPRLTLPSAAAAASIACALAAALAPASASADDALSASAIVQAALDQNGTGFQRGTARVTISTADKDGLTKTRTLSIRSSKTPQGQRSIVRFLAPAEVKGQAFLMLPNPNGPDPVYSYLPAFGTTRRLGGSQTQARFMGTHFSYDDLQKRDVKDATYARLKDETIGPHAVYVIDATPKRPADDPGAYTKVRLYIRKSDKITLKAKFFTKNDTLNKTLFVEKLDTTPDGVTYAKQTTLRPADGGFTRVIVESLDLTTPIPDAAFTPEALANP